MTSQTIARVWGNSQATGSARLLLLAIADHCDHTGLCTLSGQDMRDLTLQDGATFSDALRDLLNLKEIAPVAGNRLQVTLTAKLKQDWAAGTPAPAPQPISTPPVPKPVKNPFASVRSPYPKNLVGLLLQSARVQIDPEKPFYWHQREHNEDAEQLVRLAGGSVDAAARHLAASAPEDGITIQRLLQLRHTVEAVRGRI